MAPRKTQSKQPKSRPSGNGSTMDQAEKKARHITSEKNRLTNIKAGLAAMLPMLPPEIQSIPGIAKNQTNILNAFGEEMDRELQRERDLKAETDMLELHLKNGTIPTASECLFKYRLPTPPDTQENPAYKPASKNITPFSSQDVNRNPGNEPQYSTIWGCGAHQTDNDLDFQQTIPAAFNFNSYQANSTPGYHRYISNSPGANSHQEDNDLGVQTNNMNHDNLDQTGLDFSQLTFSDMNIGPSNGPNDAAGWTMEF